jgi:aspartyl-tRNA(Asn)/glutamyl-tRNA(Gln) amidotransferase subunit B
MSKYTPTIGLEIHAELKTKTKMFCNSANNPDEQEPNLNICPVCVGYPGTLPTINREAVKHVLKLGLAVEGKLADFSEFDRKNYFYPDIPKGYQISQYKFPLVQDGKLAGVALERIHLEEDTAKSSHEKGDYSLVDFNRAGLPLMELVTKPVIKNARDAAFFAKELQLLLKSLDAGEANMEKGEMRVEANISVSADDSLGTKVEIKNLNSFRSVERAIEFEIERQSELLEGGGKVMQETRGWNENKEETFSQRLKEFSHDYRYFPEPDLPKLYISEIPEFDKGSLEGELPELPWQKRARLSSLGFLQDQDVEQLVGDPGLFTLFAEVEKVLAEPGLVKIAANIILNDVVGQRRKDPEWSLPNEELLSEIVRKYKEGKMTSPQVKKSIVTKQIITSIDDAALPAIVKKVVEDNKKVAEEYKAGKETALQYLIGQGMKETKGSANPAVLKELFIAELK